MKFIMISDVRVQLIQQALAKHGEEELSSFLVNALAPRTPTGPSEVTPLRPREVLDVRGVQMTDP